MVTGPRRPKQTVEFQLSPAGEREVRRYLAAVPAVLKSGSTAIADKRPAYQRWLRAQQGEPADVRVVEDVVAGGTPARLFKPAGDETTALVWLHGGGWFMGDLDSTDHVARELAKRATCAVLCVDYRLAPEHPFPAGLNDCMRATEWAAREFSHVAIGGESVGGNLAAAVALRARETGLLLALQVLVYPVLDWKEFHDPQMWDAYVPDRLLRKNHEVAPLNAPSLAGVAPALVIAVDDALGPEAMDYAWRLEREGVSVELLLFMGQTHGFFTSFFRFEDGRIAVSRVAKALEEAFESRY